MKKQQKRDSFGDKMMESKTGLFVCALASIVLLSLNTISARC